MAIEPAEPQNEAKPQMVSLNLTTVVLADQLVGQVKELLIARGWTPPGQWPDGAATKTVRYDLSQAAVEGELRDKLQEMGWSPPGQKETWLDQGRQAEAAERTLEELGYRWMGGSRWKPPLGKAPSFDAPPNPDPIIVSDLDARRRMAEECIDKCYRLTEELFESPNYNDKETIFKCLDEIHRMTGQRRSARTPLNAPPGYAQRVSVAETQIRDAGQWPVFEGNDASEVPPSNAGKDLPPTVERYLDGLAAVARSMGAPIDVEPIAGHVRAFYTWLVHQGLENDKSWERESMQARQSEWAAWSNTSQVLALLARIGILRSANRLYLTIDGEDKNCLMFDLRPWDSNMKPLYDWMGEKMRILKSINPAVTATAATDSARGAEAF